MEIHELFDLCKGEPEFLVRSDEQHAFKVGLLIAAVTGGSPCRFRKKTLSLLKTDVCKFTPALRANSPVRIVTL